MQHFNIINYIHILDLSILNFVDYLDVIENRYELNENQQLPINLTSKNKKILTGFIINNINNNIQVGTQNLIINTCKPMQNWRQYSRGNAVRSYKYKLIDESIYIDLIKFNQFVDSVFCKLPTLNLNKVSETYLGENDILKFKFQNKIKCLQFETIDTIDTINILHTLLKSLGNVNYNTLSYNNLIVTDGNHEYAHGSVCSGDVVDIIRRNLLEKGIL
jgi:hypothetical protein